MLAPGAGHEQGGAGADQHQRCGAAEAVALAEPCKRDHQRGQTSAEQQGARVVDRPVAAAFASRQSAQRAACQKQCRGREQRREPEHRAPGDVVGQVAADHRAGYRGERKHPGEQALVAAALGARGNVGDGGVGQREQSSSSRSLEHPQHQQLRGRLRQHRADPGHQVDQDRHQQRQPPAIEVGELAVDRRADGGRHQIARNQPGHQVETAELACDGHQRDRQDGLVHRRDQDCHRQPQDDVAAVGAAQSGRRVRMCLAFAWFTCLVSHWARPGPMPVRRRPGCRSGRGRGSGRGCRGCPRRC